MARRLDEDLYAQLPGTLHYNVWYRDGGLHSRVTQRHLMSLKVKPEMIYRVWIVELNRYATPEEIAKFYGGK